MKKTLLLLSAATLLSSATCCREDVEMPSPSQPIACTLVPEPGMCNAAFVRYYYDPKEKKCKQFVWGGCNGVVPFVTLQECLDCGCDQSNN
ncbi:BPTI/Kunitz-type proteinase inhibitor domain-containing protein [uncultured Hymenobacter sp.]|uniref:BPTI/Kunitz-type proteinase inhibitor domain-containing protein n=1 Tax=uncultured Hymenobacter sp. TaxID=170016 RepID=UPI0035CC7858